MRKEEEAILEFARKAREEEEKESKKINGEEQARIKQRVCHSVVYVRISFLENWLFTSL